MILIAGTNILKTDLGPSIRKNAIRIQRNMYHTEIVVKKPFITFLAMRGQIQYSDCGNKAYLVDRPNTQYIRLAGR